MILTTTFQTHQAQIVLQPPPKLPRVCSPILQARGLTMQGGYQILSSTKELVRWESVKYYLLSVTQMNIPDAGGTKENSTTG